jgi:glutamate-ammonia-ligase adenylyltransferase
MRLKVSEGHPNDSGQFDIKHDIGGMVDIEFIVQYLVLRFSHQHKKLLGNLGNIALLGIAAEEELIEQADAGEVAQAYRIYREHQHRIRLDGAEKTRIRPEEMDLVLTASKDAVVRLWQKVLCT